ncbi:hypothetical protein [Halorussus amylolyticus]|uniref:hypothetical protein n=1 Tax=Halorussus amylolyticus TaxID=1126242 RepID=UPI001052B780|nr:hypothetical protein [Halorussus amylolyticus]
MNPDGALPDWQRRLKDRHGENPARFLDHRLVEYGADHTDHTLSRMVKDRVRGIDRIEIVRVWKAVERRLDRGPRKPILDLLDEREAFLEEHGERPPDLRTEWPHELPERYQPTEREVPPKECFIVKANGERVPYDERPTKATVGRSFDKERSSTEVAADGGDRR